MKFTSALVTAASGSIGGCVAARNRHGLYLRARAVPVNPQTAEQQGVRSKFATLAATWVTTLSVDERTSWNTYADNVNVAPPFGNPTYLLGLNWYIACNAFREQLGLSRVTLAPSTFSLASKTDVTVVADDSANTVTVAYNNGDQWATEVGGALGIYVGLPINASRSFFKGPYLFKDKVLGAVTPPTSPKVISNIVISEGQKIGVQVRACYADGRISSTQRILQLVVA